MPTTYSPQLVARVAPLNHPVSGLAAIETTLSCHPFNSSVALHVFGADASSIASTLLALFDKPCFCYTLPSSISLLADSQFHDKNTSRQTPLVALTRQTPLDEDLDVAACLGATGRLRVAMSTRRHATCGLPCTKSKRMQDDQRHDALIACHGETFGPSRRFYHVVKTSLDALGPRLIMLARYNKLGDSLAIDFPSTCSIDALSYHEVSLRQSHGTLAATACPNAAALSPQLVSQSSLLLDLIEFAGMLSLPPLSIDAIAPQQALYASPGIGYTWPDPSTASLNPVPFHSLTWQGGLIPSPRIMRLLTTLCASLSSSSLSTASWAILHVTGYRNVPESWIGTEHGATQLDGKGGGGENDVIIMLLPGGTHAVLYAATCAKDGLTALPKSPS